MKLIDTYKQQYREFTNFSDFNLEERVMRVPAEKHNWVERLSDAKIEHYKLLRQRKNDRMRIAEKIIENSEVGVNKNTLSNQLDNHKDLEDINDRVQDLEILIDFLEDTVKNVSFIAQDVKNILTLKQLREN